VPKPDIEAVPKLATIAFVAISEMSPTHRFFRVTRGRRKSPSTVAAIVTTNDSDVSAPPPQEILEEYPVRPPPHA
jgi:hypothetical protein